MARTPRAPDPQPRAALPAQKGLEVYRELLEVVRDHSVMLEEYARAMVHAEEWHLGEVDKMLRSPGEIGSAR